jgi:ABC-type lipoprotein export system ATPase subunit
MIRLSGVHRSYQNGKHVREVLAGVELEIGDGEFLSIIGPSGSGKSTLLNIVGGLDSAYSGSVQVGARELRGMSDADLSDYRNRHVGFVFQAFNLLDHLTCTENVALPALFRRAARGPGDGGAAAPTVAGESARAAEVLAQVGMGERGDALPTSLSGGQKQRVAIARALFGRPRLMLCDEPTGNLDLATGASILELFHDLNRRHGITLVIVTHEENISRAADRVIRLEDGRIRSDVRSARSAAAAAAAAAEGAPPAPALASVPAQSSEGK